MLLTARYHSKRDVVFGTLFLLWAVLRVFYIFLSTISKDAQLKLLDISFTAIIFLRNCGHATFVNRPFVKVV